MPPPPVLPNLNITSPVQNPMNNPQPHGGFSSNIPSGISSDPQTVLQTVANLASAIQNPNVVVPVTVNDPVVAQTTVKPKDNTSITKTSYLEKPKNRMKMPMFNSNDSFDDFILHFESIID